MSDMLETVTKDLLERVQKLEAEKHIEKVTTYLSTLDRVMFSTTVTLDVLSEILVNKGITTKEEINKLIEERAGKIVQELQLQNPEKK